MPRSLKSTSSDALASVKFKLPPIDAESIAICGEFNDWATDATHLERASDGSWIVSIDLQPGRSYRYRYLLDGSNWENDWEPDGYEPNAYGGHDSVVVVPPALAAAPPKRTPRSTAAQPEGVPKRTSRARTVAQPQEAPKRTSRTRTDAAA